MAATVVPAHRDTSFRPTVSHVKVSCLIKVKDRKRYDIITLHEANAVLKRIEVLFFFVTTLRTVKKKE